MQTRTPPHDGDAERAVLGSIMLENSTYFDAVDIVTADDFYIPSHGIVLRAMAALVAANQPIDSVTLSNHLRATREIDTIGGIPGLVGLSLHAPTAANVRHYAEIVRAHALRRRMIAAGSEIVRNAFEAPTAEAAVDDAERAVFEIAHGSAQSLKPMSARDVIGQAFDLIEKRAEDRRAVTGVPTGIYDLDDKTAGLQPTDLIIIAGRPGSGKTSLGVGVAQHAAIEAGVPSAVFSLEMGKVQLGMRMLSSEGRVESSKMRTGFLADGDWPKLARAASVLAEAPIVIDDTPSVTVTQVRSVCRRLAARPEGLGLVVIDYLQLMRGDADADNREQEISSISRGLKALAKELNIPVVALSQLNRSLEQRKDKRPMMSDIRESGAVEQDADVIMFVYRDEYYNPDTEDKGIAEIIIGKQRNGGVGTVKAKFLHEYTRFESLASNDSWVPPRE